jgi:tRNA-Thr(GGU) m(6)t(6)A37 methyltransferase TsaA
MEHIRFIGIVHSPLTTLQDCPLQESEGAPNAIIEVYGEFAEAMKDLQAGDKIIMFTWLNQSDRSVLSTHPRNDTSNRLTGVFSTRSPDRPNPIGIHFVNIKSVLPGNRLQVSQLEVLNGTPVVDIKPDLS